MLEYFLKVRAILGSHYWKFLFIVALAVLQTLADLVSLGSIVPLLTFVFELDGQFEFISKLRNSFPDDNDLILLFGITIILSAIIKFALSLVITSQIVSYAASQNNQMRKDILHSLLAQRFKQVDQKQFSRLVYMLQEQCTVFASRVLQGILKITTETLLVLGILCLLILSNPLFTSLAILFLFAVAFLVDRVFRATLMQQGRSVNELSANYIQATNEFTTSLNEITFLAKERFFYDRFLSISKQQTSKMAFSSFVFLVPKYFFELLAICTFVLAIIISEFVFGDFETLAPLFGLYLASTFKLLPAISSISNHILQLRFFRDTVWSISEQLRHKNLFDPHSIDMRRVTDKKVEFQSLDLKQIGFRFDEDSRTVLANADLKIERGDVIGIRGESGSGKTTLLNIMLGKLTPNTGKILVNGQEEKSSEELMTFWRGRLCYIPQNFAIINDTIARNITFSETIIPEENQILKEAINFAALTNDLPSTTQGSLSLNEVSEKNGIDLSGGQKQRVAIARAFFHQSEVFIFDEITSALDYKTEALMWDNMREFLQERTAVIISHRTNAFKLCDKVYSLDNGILKIEQ